MVRSAMDLRDVRRHHLSLVLEHLTVHGPRSRAQLASAVGLTKATVSAVVADLLDRELVEELGPSTGGVGRPATAVGVRGSGVGALGLQIDADRISACVVDLGGTVRIDEQHLADNRDVAPGVVLDRLRAVAAAALDRAVDEGITCAGGGLAVPGLVDPTGELFVAPNLHWLDVDLAGLDLGVAVTIDNEANFAALAELRHGTGRTRSSFVYVSGGVGVGAGLVLDGRLARGAHGFAGELGHVTVDHKGRRCACGRRGCLETVVGAGRRASTRDRVEALVAALATVVHVLDPEAVVLGGTVADPALAGAVEAGLRACTLGARWRPCAVIASELGDGAALLGAATAALDAVVADPTTIPSRSSRPA